MDYNFRAIEQKWQQHWNETHAYKVSNVSDKPKCYVLDMFPYPSGAGLHVGHPLGYISSDIYARYKRLKGFNVLHPMGYDAFGLPAEQYAIEHGVHPAVSTEQNINNFRKQLDKIGFSYDWSREVNTSKPDYYKWTQWIFLKLFTSWFNRATQKAEDLALLIDLFEKEGNKNHACPGDESIGFTADEWKHFDNKRRQEILMHYRLAFCGYGEVNWCEALGTVLANDEVVNGVSERGGHPVVKKKLRQWYLRITEFADRLLTGLQTVDFSEPMKEMQTNWIGKSQGAEITFAIKTSPQPLSKGEGQAVATNTIPGYVTTSAAQWPILSAFAKENRKNATEAEDTLWQSIRNRKIEGHKFRRQHPIAGFIPDYVCLEKKLIIEVDGDYHNTDEQKAFDEARAAWLAENGYQMLRFSNDEVVNQLPTVLQKIAVTLASCEVSDTGNNPSPLERGRGEVLTVYTTRPDTVFGVDFMVVAPELDLIHRIASPEQAQAVADYIAYVKSRSDRERQAEKKISGCFTGAYAINPFDGREIPIWISEYVLAGYGTGAIMAVPCGDERDFKFAQHFNIPITNILGDAFNGLEANNTKDAKLTNSGFLNGMVMRDAMGIAIDKLEAMGIGKRKVNFKMRDAAFSRQRYWGEPFPIKWSDGVAIALNETELPLLLPEVDSYSPGPEGEGPLANIPEWVAKELETNTMPGYAGSSWYFLRYMDSHNPTEFCNRHVSDYWNQVDMYIGGTEHAVGHLLYSRMWTKALHDLGYISFDEPFKKLVNQGMITGSSRFVFRIHGTNTFVSFGFINEKELSYEGNSLDKIHVDVNIVDGFVLNTEAFLQWKMGEFAGAEFILEDGKYICGAETEKMSKSKFNTVNPDDLVEKYGADTFRMYEMFLGPVEQSKPWDTKGIEGVHRFLKKLWRLCYDEMKGQVWVNEQPTAAELKILHKTIRKIDEDTERFSYNTAVSAFMVCVNELADAKCHKKAIIEQVLILLTPYAPHIAEELWHLLGNTSSVLDAAYPVYNPAYTVESAKEYPVSINGKVRTNINISLDATAEEVEAIALANETIQKWLEGKPPKKFIFVKNKMINVVI